MDSCPRRAPALPAEPRGRDSLLYEHVLSPKVCPTQWACSACRHENLRHALRLSTRRNVHSHAAGGGFCTPAGKTHLLLSPRKKTPRYYRVRKTSDMLDSRRMPSLPDPLLRFEHCSSWIHLGRNAIHVHSGSCAQFRFQRNEAALFSLIPVP